MPGRTNGAEEYKPGTGVYLTNKEEGKMRERKIIKRICDQRKVGEELRSLTNTEFNNTLNEENSATVQCR